jgi:hypothetical protein
MHIAAADRVSANRTLVTEEATMSRRHLMTLLVVGMVLVAVGLLYGRVIGDRMSHAASGSRLSRGEPADAAGTMGEVQPSSQEEPASWTLLGPMDPPDAEYPQPVPIVTNQRPAEHVRAHLSPAPPWATQQRVFVRTSTVPDVGGSAAQTPVSSVRYESGPTPSDKSMTVTYVEVEASFWRKEILASPVETRSDGTQVFVKTMNDEQQSLVAIVRKDKYIVTLFGNLPVDVMKAYLPDLIVQPE